MMSEEKQHYYVGSKETGWKISEGNTSLNLDSGKLKIDNAKISYHDENGKEITKEQFNEIRILKLEEKILSMEGILTSLQTEINELSIELDNI